MGDKRDRHEPSSISYMVTVYHSVKCTFVPSVFSSVYNPSFILSENLPLQIRTWLQPAGCLIDVFYTLIDLTLTCFINSDFAFYIANPVKTSCIPESAFAIELIEWKDYHNWPSLHLLFTTKIFAQSMARL